MRKHSLTTLTIVFAIAVFPHSAYAGNAGDYYGGVAIGSGYASVSSAPANGLIVQGNVGLGTSAASQPFVVNGNADVMGSNGYLMEVANASTTGTTANKLAKLTGAPSTAVIPATTDTDGIIGIVVGGAGTTGNAQIAINGQASCVFENTTTAGDFVTVGATTAGDCHDAGSTRPASGEVIGRVLSSVSSGSSASVALSLSSSASSGQWTVSGSNIYYSTGNVGIGTSTINSALQVNGEVQVGNSAASCTSSNAGAIRYTSSSLYLCDGTSWKQQNGGYILISTATASNSASVSFTSIPQTYQQCEIRLTNVVAATANATLQMQGSENNGSTWVSSNYVYNGTIVNYQGSTTYSNADPASSIVLSGIQQYNSGIGASGVVTAYAIGNSSTYKVFNYQITAPDNNHGAVQSIAVGTGEYFGDNNAFNALKFFFSSGNITSGTFSLYCIPN